MDDTIAFESPPPPPPPPGPAGPRPFRRSRDDRMVAGVAGGLGRYLGIDPVLVRVAFVALTLVGGSGLLIYLVIWLVTDADDGSTALLSTDRLRNRPPGSGIDTTTVLAVALVVGALLVLGSRLVFFDIGGETIVAVALVALGVYLLLRDRPDPTPPPRDGRVDPAVPASAGEGPTTSLVPTLPPPTGPATTGAATTGAATTGAALTGPALTAPALPPAPVVGTSPPSPPAPRQGTFLTPVTLAATAVVLGVLGLVDGLTDVDVSLAQYLATALGVIAIGVLVSTFVGRAPALAVLGLVLLPFVVVANAFDFPLHQGIGEASERVTDEAELADEYLHGIGEYTVDLTELTIGADETVDIGLSIGRLDVLVATDQSIVVDAHVRAGEIVLPDDTTDGIDVDATWARTRPDEPVLELDVEVGLGQINVVEVDR